jgi:hypothetical protein
MPRNTTRLPRTIPFGRLAELRARPDANLIAYTMGAGIFDDCRLKLYASREALRVFCQDGSDHHALVKELVSALLIENRNHQRPAP